MELDRVEPWGPASTFSVVPTGGLVHLQQVSPLQATFLGSGPAYVLSCPLSAALSCVALGRPWGAGAPQPQSPVLCALPTQGPVVH